MPATVFVIDPDGSERAWIESAPAPVGHAIAYLDDGAALFARLPPPPPACLLTCAEPDAAATLALVRELRARHATLPLVVLGAHSAVRTAVDIARFPATDFLERPVSNR